MRITCDVGGFELFWPPTPTLGRSSDKATILAGETKKPCSKSETKPFFQRPFFCFISLFKSHLFFHKNFASLTKTLPQRPFHFQNRNVFSQKLFHFHQGFATSTKVLPFSQSLLLTRPYLVFKG